MSSDKLWVTDEVIISTPSSPVIDAAVEVEEVLVSEVEYLYLNFWNIWLDLNPTPKEIPELSDLTSPLEFSLSWSKTFSSF